MARSDPFARLPVLLGVVHVRPLPGAPRYAGSMAGIVAQARADVLAYRAAGFDGVIVENFGDAPFFAGAVPPETVAGLAVVLAEVRDAAGGMLRGANVLRNDARAALALAAAAELDLVRVNVLAGATVTDQGLLQSDAALVLRDRARLAPRVAIVADVRVKHARPLAPGPLAEEAQDLVERAGADALVVTGARTGAAAASSDLGTVRTACPRTPLLVGSGATADTLADLLARADGVIVGTSVKRGGVTTAPVDLRRARSFVRAARTARARGGRPRG